MKIIHNWISGNRRLAASGKWEMTLNPANPDQVVGKVNISNELDVDAAVQAAKAALPKWRSLSGPARAELLYAASDKLSGKAGDIAELMMMEMGKTLPESKGEVKRGIDILRYYAGECLRKSGDVIPNSDANTIQYTTRIPLGVVGLITPWNFPAAIPLWKSAPALACGNTIVIKPALEAAATTQAVMDIFHEAGLPEGVVNVIHGGAEAGSAIVKHPEVNGLSFTGSNRVGKMIGREVYERGCKVQLEMGGKNAVIVTEHADLDKAVRMIVSSAMKSAGQKCTATSRAIVHENVYEVFASKVIQEVSRLKIGPGDSGADIGPVVSLAQFEKVLRYIDIGREEGAELLTGGNRLQQESLHNGYFIEPTVFGSVSPNMTVAKEEIFGPVLALIPYQRFEEAIGIADDTEYGLSAAIYTMKLDEALAFASSIQAGMIRVNGETAGVEYQAPFGGLKSSSSHSREQGTAAMDFYSQLQTISISI